MQVSDQSKGHLLHALQWSYLSEIASRAIQPLVFVVLARLLTPEDYGVVAAATMVISFSQIFWEAGMGKAVIQYQGDRTAAANAAFWINNALGVVVAGVLIAISSIVANKIFHDPRVASVLQVMSVQVLLSAAASVHSALLQKDMRFKRLFWVRLATGSLPSLVSIALAWQGMGYWSLVAGTLVGQAIQTVILWRTSPWKPRLSFDAAVAKQLARFGGWVAATGLLAWVYLWVDSLILGLYFGTSELGLFRVGNQFAILVFSMLFGPILPVLYSHLSATKKDIQLVSDRLAFINRSIATIALPSAATIFLASDDIAQIVFGGSWSGVGFIIGFIALKEGLLWTLALNTEGYRALSKPNYETWITFLSAFIQPFVLVYAGGIGFDFFIHVRALFLGLWGFLVHSFFACLVFGKSGLRSLLPIIRIESFCLAALSFYEIIKFHNVDQISDATVKLLSVALVWIPVFVIERRNIVAALYMTKRFKQSL